MLPGITGYCTWKDRILYLEWTGYCTWNVQISYLEWTGIVPGMIGFFTWYDLILYLDWPDIIPWMTGYRTKNDRICCTWNDRISYQEWPDMLYLEWPDIVPRMTGYAVPGMNRTGCLWPAVLSSAAWSKYRVLKSKIDHKPQKIKFHFFNSASLITYIKKHLLSNFVIFLYEILIYWKNMRCG